MNKHNARGPAAGLKGVVVADTSIGDVRGDEGFFHYREYAALDLAERHALDEVWLLVLDGALPDQTARAALHKATERPQALAFDLANTLAPSWRARAGSQANHEADGAALGALRSALSQFGAVLGARPLIDLTPAARRSDVLALAAATPVLAAAWYRASRGLAPIAPRTDLGHTENYAYMLTGVVPTRELARALEQYLILTVDHGFNASTFTARVIASTGADAAAAIVGALGALSGPLHGGAPSRALEALDAIGAASRAEAWVDAQFEAGKKIMGFGHAVYRTRDPRSEFLKGVAQRLGGARVALALEAETHIVRALRRHKPEAPLYANVEYYAGIVMERCGIPAEMFTATFAVSRVIGWSAHILEQAAGGKILRPSARYVGPAPVGVSSGAPSGSDVTAARLEERA